MALWGGGENDPNYHVQCNGAPFQNPICKVLMFNTHGGKDYVSDANPFPPTLLSMV